MLNSWHYTRDELKEEEKTIFYTWLTSIALNLLNHFLHHSRVVAWMNAQLAARNLRMRLKSDRLLCVICHDVLVHLRLGQELPLLGVALQP